MLNITICDDERTEIEYLTLLVRSWAAARRVAVRVSPFESAESFLFHYEEDKTADLLLLDIQMKAMDGLALAKRVRQGNDGVQIVFITGYPDFIAEGYEVDALHYLMKPVGEEKLCEVLDRALARLNKAEPVLHLTLEGENLRVPFKDIRFMEAQGHYVHIHTESKTFRVKMNLSDIQKTLDERFFRCQRSFIVNLRYAARITRKEFVLDDGASVPLSRDLYEAANRAVIDYFP